MPIAPSKPKQHQPRRVALTENLRLFEQKTRPRVDREAGIIHGVTILGKQSLNDGGRRIYSDESLADAAQKYEGMQANYNHPALGEANRDRDFHEAAGELHNIVIGDDGIYGDLHVLTEHPHAGMLFEAAERMPGRFGLSHNAEGSVERDANGNNVVRRLNKVRSVDIVHKPATNSSLFESEPPISRKATQMKLSTQCKEQDDDELDEGEPVGGTADSLPDASGDDSSDPAVMLAQILALLRKLTGGDDDSAVATDDPTPESSEPDETGVGSPSDKAGRSGAGAKMKRSSSIPTGESFRQSLSTPSRSCSTLLEARREGRTVRRVESDVSAVDIPTGDRFARAMRHGRR